MKKLIFIFVFSTIAIFIILLVVYYRSSSQPFDQRRNAIFHDAGFYFLQSTVPVDSICATEFLFAGNAEDNDDQEVLSTYSSGFYENGIINRYLEKDRDNKKVKEVVFDGRHKIRKMKCFYFDSENPHLLVYKLDKEKGNVNYWNVYKLSPNSGYSKYGEIESIMIVDTIKEISTMNDGVGVTWEQYDENGKLLFKNIELAKKGEEYKSLRTNKLSYNGNLGIEERAYFSIKISTGEKKMLKSEIERFEFNKFDANGNWTECIVSYDDEIYKKCVRKLYYPN